MTEDNEMAVLETARSMARLSFELIPHGALVMSNAHTWAQALPLRDHILVCINCGYRRAIKANDAQICRIRAESIRSGFGGPVVLQGGGKPIGIITAAGEGRICQFVPS